MFAVVHHAASSQLRWPCEVPAPDGERHRDGPSLLALTSDLLLPFAMAQVVVMALIIGSAFWMLGNSQSDARLFFGVSFMSVLFLAMG